MTTLRGVIRSLEASARRTEREQKRKLRELEKLQKESAKLEEFQRALYEVETYENNISLLQSMHLDCGENCNWIEIKNMKPPTEPKLSKKNEIRATTILNEYKPSLFDKLFKKDVKKIENFKIDIAEAKKKDEDDYKKLLHEYEVEFNEWKENTNLAERILNRDIEAYRKALAEVEPLSEINELGTEITFLFPNENLIDVELKVHSEEVIPKEIKSLLKSGKLSVKQMPSGRFNEIYQDHICSSVLRIGRELFALLPIEKIVLTAYGDLLNTQTGNKEYIPILSVLLSKQTMAMINFENIDPSDSMKNFVHNMEFKKNQGFVRVEKLDYSNFNE